MSLKYIILKWSWKCVKGLLWHYYIKMSYTNVHLLHMHIVFYRERTLHQLVCGNAWLVYLHLEGASQILLYSTALTGNYQTGPKYLDTVIKVYMNLKVTSMSFYCKVHIKWSALKLLFFVCLFGFFFSFLNFL